jgi:hypothetical protein
MPMPGVGALGLAEGGDLEPDLDLTSGEGDLETRLFCFLFLSLFFL